MNLFRGLLIVFFLLNAGLVEGKNMMQRVVENSNEVETIRLLTIPAQGDTQLSAELKKYKVFKVDQTSLNSLNLKSEKIATMLPSPDGDVEVELVKVNIFSKDFDIETSSGYKMSPSSKGQHYWGYVKGEENSFVTLSVFKDQWMALVSNEQKGNLVIRKLANKNEYISFYEHDKKNALQKQCNTEESLDDIERIQNLSKTLGTERRVDNCVRVHVEASNNTFKKYETHEATLEYIEALFSNVFALFEAEDIPMSVSYIKIWDTEDPFVKTSSALFTGSFGAQFSQGQTLNGDLAHILHPSSIGGVAGQAGGIGGLCGSDLTGRVAWSSITGDVKDIPTYSEDVATVVHEIGHNMGSPHTHGCYWNGNNTSIDDCGTIAGNTEGAACFDDRNPIVPADGGTIMSYCHLNRVGIALSKGFGNQPGNLIRSVYDNASCLSVCEDEEQSCGVILDFEVIEATETSISVEWSNSDASSYEISWTKFDGTPTTPVTATSPFEITGLESGAIYEISLVAVCASGYKMKSINAKATTVCTEVYGLPYFESFENNFWTPNSYELDPCWRSTANNFYGWMTGDIDTYLGLTGPRSDHTKGDGKYMLADAQFGATNERALLFTPSLDLTSGKNHFISFWYYMYGEQVNRLQIQVRTESFPNWVNLRTINGQQQTAETEEWKQQVVNLASYNGEIVQIRFIATRGASEESDIAIDDVLISDSSFIDLSLKSINSATSGCNLSENETTSVTIQNAGFSTILAGTTLKMELMVDGGTAVSEDFVLAQDLIPGGEVDYTFNSTNDLSSYGVHDIETNIIYASDQFTTNNTKSIQVLNKPVISEFTYSEDFESGNGNWLAGGVSSTWAFGTPNKTVIKGASSGVNAWVTGGLGSATHESYEASYIESPCLDFTDVTDPRIEMDLWWDIEYEWDAAIFQASKDKGETWVKIGKRGDPDNWYNSTLIADAVILPGGTKDVWSGSVADNNTGSKGWVTAKHAIDGMAGESTVLLRLLFMSDPFVEFDGIGLDNIVIKEGFVIDPCDDLTANFTFAEGDAPNEIEFTNTSENATSYSWNFGDTKTSIETNPTHVYDETGPFTVVLTASLEGCDDVTASKNIEILSTGLALNFIDRLSIFPNPNSGAFMLTMEGESSNRDVTFSIIDVSGKVLQVFNDVYQGGLQKTFNMSDYANGEYFLNIQSGNEKTNLKISLMR